MPQAKMILALGLVLTATGFGAFEASLSGQVGAARVTVTDVRYSESSASSGVEVEVGLDTSGPPTFTRGEVADPPRVFIDIDDARVGPGLHNKVVSVGSDVLEGIRVAQHDPDTVRVVLDLTSNSAVSVFRLSEPPYRLVVDVVSLVAEAEPASVADVAARPPPAPVPAPRGVLDVRAFGGRVSIRAQDVLLGELLSQLDSVAGTESTVAPTLQSYRIDASFDGLPVDQAIAKLFEGKPFDYAVLAQRRIFVLGVSEGGTPFVPVLPAVREVPAVPPEAPNPTCRLPEGARYPVGATPVFADETYLCASVLTEGEQPRVGWVRMESSGGTPTIPAPATGDPCTLENTQSYAVGSVVLQNGAVYRCVPVLDDNLTPAGTAWVTSDEARD
jgi:AMIN domain